MIFAPEFIQTLDSVYINLICNIFGYVLLKKKNGLGFRVNWRATKMWQLEQEERRSQPAFPSQPMQLCGWHETSSLPPQMPFNLTCSAQVQAS